MNDKLYFRYIWSTLMNSFNFRGRAGRTEYAYFMLFFISCTILYLPLIVVLLGNPNEIMEGKVSFNPISLSLFNCYLLFLFCISFSTIALTFRRCRDIGHTMLILLPCMAFLIFVVGVLGILRILNFEDIEDTNIIPVLFLLPIIILLVFPLLLTFIRGKAHLSKITENKGSSLCAEIKKRYIVLAVVTVAFLMSLFVFHFNYDFTDWWVDEWIIICCAFAVYFVIIASYYIIISRKLFRH